MSHGQEKGKRKWLLAFVLNGKDGAASSRQGKEKEKNKTNKAFMGQQEPATSSVSCRLPDWEIGSFTLSASLSCCRKERW